VANGRVVRVIATIGAENQVDPCFPARREDLVRLSQRTTQGFLAVYPFYTGLRGSNDDLSPLRRPRRDRYDVRTLPLQKLPVVVVEMITSPATPKVLETLFINIATGDQ